MLMIKTGVDLLLQDFIKKVQFDDQPCFRVDLPFNRNLKDIVVSMPMWIVALAEDLLIFLTTKIWAVQTVCCAKFVNFS